MDSSSSRRISNTTLYNTDFCSLLANQILEKEASKGNNFVASPLSIHVMLSLMASGSKGATLEELLQFLRSESVSDLNLLSSKIISLASPFEGSESLSPSGPLLSFVNGVFCLDQSFSLKSSFEGIAKHSYKAEIKSVDFLTKAEDLEEEVNSWAETATKGLIKQLLPTGSLNNQTALVLANALYFKGSWNQPFDPSMTQLRAFHLLNGQTLQLPFMTTKLSTEHSFGLFGNYKVLKIPYQSGHDPRNFSMYFFLPDEKDGLPNLIQKMKLNPGFLSKMFWLNSMKLDDFWIPKFKFSSEFKASETMKEMGLKLPFKPGGLTEISDIPNKENLYVSNIFHKSFIEVNEEGTEAAASTCVPIQLFCARPLNPSFVADHPFLFMIREETHRMVFFVGAILNPLLDA